MSIYTSHEWLPIVGVQTGTYTGGPRKLVLHTTEGSLPGALAAYHQKGVVPHFTWDFPGRKRLQHVDTIRSVSALSNDMGGVQTNRDSAIQVEITGFAADSHNWSDAILHWLAVGIEEICRKESINARHFPRFVGESEHPAGEGAAQRMTFSEWDNFDGVCGHQHVPENEHWDPGALNYPKILSYMEDDMTLDELLKALQSGPIRDEIKEIVQGAGLDALREKTDANPDRGTWRTQVIDIINDTRADGG